MKVGHHPTKNRTTLTGAFAYLLAITAMGVAGSAHADPISFLPGNTGFSIKFVDRERAITGLGQNLFGIFDITQINSADSSSTFWNGNGISDGTQLVGFFNGLISIPDQTGGTGLSFTGGTVEIFNVANGSYKPSINPNTLDPVNQLCNGAACPSPWLTLNFVPGINDALGPTGNATLQAALATTNVQAGFGYLSVTGGTNGATFDTNSFAFTNFAPADLFFRSNFVLAGSQACPLIQSNGWAVCSDDPITGRTVPEPGTLALLGLGLAALGGLKHRKKTA